MSNLRVSLLDQGQQHNRNASSCPHLLKLGTNEAVMRPFTADVARVKLHYVDDRELQGYVQCNGLGCALCRAGRAVDEKDLLPVLVPTDNSVQILAISSSCRPGALRPQILPLLRSSRNRLVFVTKPDRITFAVATKDAPELTSEEEDVIKRFAADWDNGSIDLASVYPTYSNEVLAGVQSVAKMLRLKGITVDDHHD